MMENVVTHIQCDTLLWYLTGRGVMLGGIVSSLKIREVMKAAIAEKEMITRK
jgi:hypothetical protein